MMGFVGWVQQAHALGHRQHIPEDSEERLYFRLARHWLANAQALLTGHNRVDLLVRMSHVDFHHPIVHASAEVIDAVFTCVQHRLVSLSLTDDVLSHLSEIALVHAMRVYEGVEGRAVFPDNGKVRAHVAYAARLIELSTHCQRHGAEATHLQLREHVQSRAQHIREKAKYILQP